MNQSKYNKQQYHHVRRVLKAIHCSLSGLKAAFKDNISFKQEVFLTFIVVFLALFLEITVSEQVLLIGSWFLVLIVEVINSSIELLVDRISLEIHPLSKKIKDISAGAVFLAVINTIIVWGIILIRNYF